MSEPLRVSGPTMEWPEDTLTDSRELASFRALTTYNPMNDTMVLRLDVKVDELQHNVSLTLGRLPERFGERIRRTDPLIVPNKGVDVALGGLADRKTLVAKLKELAEKLEQMA